MTTPRSESSRGADPLGYGRAFEQALAQPELEPYFGGGEVGPDARRGAYWLGVTLGRCRLYGVRVDNADGVLPASIATAAAQELADHLARWIEDACRLPERWRPADGPAEAEEMCFDLLESRMEAWAAMVAIEEAYRDCLVGVDPALGAFRPVVRHLVEALHKFDDSLKGQQPFLAVGGDTNLLRNWKAMLALPYAHALPWWLDGRLEDVAERVVTAAVESQPQRFPQVPRSAPSTIPAVVPGRGAYDTVLGNPRAECEAQETPLATAAAIPDASLTSERMALAARTFPVKGDDLIRVQLDLVRPPEVSVPEVRVLLIGSPAAVERYNRFEICIPGRPDSLTGIVDGYVGGQVLGAGEVQALETEIQALLQNHEVRIRLSLFTLDETCWAVLLRSSDT